MSTLTNSSNADSVKKIHHDLGAVLGNLRAFEFLFFSQPNAGKSADYKETYGDLMKSLDLIVARMAALETKSKAPENVGSTVVARQRT